MVGSSSRGSISAVPPGLVAIVRQNPSTEVLGYCHVVPTGRSQFARLLTHYLSVLCDQDVAGTRCGHRPGRDGLRIAGTLRFGLVRLATKPGTTRSTTDLAIAVSHLLGRLDSAKGDEQSHVVSDLQDSADQEWRR